MPRYVSQLEEVINKFPHTRTSSFDIAHVCKTLQLIQERGNVSRKLLSKELELGEGTIRNLLRQLKTNDLILTTKAGTKMTRKGISLFSQFLSLIPREMGLSKCSITLGKHNYAILVKQSSKAIKSGIEQRDAAIKTGASGATTLLFKSNKFVIPENDYDALSNDFQLSKQMIRVFHPSEGDVIIIGSDNHSKKRADYAAKIAALTTIINYRRA